MAASRFNFAILFILFFATVLRINAGAPSAPPTSCSLAKPSLELRDKLLQKFEKCQSDIQLDQYSLTGFTLTDKSSLNKIITDKSAFFSSHESICGAQAKRKSYIEYNANKLKKLQKQVQEILEANANDEDKQKAEIEVFARHAVHKRNVNRMSRYDTEAKKRRLRERNLEKYDNEEGPTPEYLLNKYGSWLDVIYASARPQRCLSFALGILPDEEELAQLFPKQEL